jgi:hypothetical protein
LFRARYQPYRLKQLARDRIDASRWPKFMTVSALDAELQQCRSILGGELSEGELFDRLLRGLKPVIAAAVEKERTKQPALTYQECVALATVEAEFDQRARAVRFQTQPDSRTLQPDSRTLQPSRFPARPAAARFNSMDADFSDSDEECFNAMRPAKGRAGAMRRGCLLCGADHRTFNCPEHCCGCCAAKGHSITDCPVWRARPANSSA